MGIQPKQHITNGAITIDGAFSLQNIVNRCVAACNITVSNRNYFARKTGKNLEQDYRIVRSCSSF